jgi:hypothetical protein
MMRIEHDYQRRGALAYLAAWDVHRGQVIGRVAWRLRVIFVLFRR